jgi:DNA-binding NtrC family response regulator
VTSDVTSHPTRLLVVDDDEAMRHALGRLLRSEGYVAVFAATINELRVVLARGPVDVVLLDMHLGEDDDFEHVLSALSQQVAAPRVLLMSADADSGEVAAARGLPFLEKPFTIEQLVDTVNEAMRTAPT